MMLRLTIENVPSLASGDPVEMLLAEHGLVIGRAAHADWTLPDPQNHISSLQCEIDYCDGRYIVTDRSTNGTFLNGSPQRLAAPTQLRDGDLLQIGHYQIRVEELADGQSSGAASTGVAPITPHGFGGVDWHSGGGEAASPVPAQNFGREPPRPLFQSAQDPLMAAFAAPKVQSPPAGAGNPFGVGGGASNPFGVGSAPAPAMPAGGGSPGPANPFGITSPAAPANPFGVAAPAASPPPAAPLPAGDPFGVGGAGAPSPFGLGGAPSSAAPAARHDPFGVGGAAGDPFAGFDPGVPAAPPASPPPVPASPPTGAADPWSMLGGANAIDFSPPAASPIPSPAPPPVAPPPQAPSAPPPQAVPVTAAVPPETPADDGLFDRLLAATGLTQRDLGGRPPEKAVEAIGQLLRQTANGLFRLLEARTRVRHQFGVGAQVTVFQSEGNNPLKWTRSPEEALKQMIGAPARGFLEGTQAVQGAFEDLQAHEMAMIAAMQEAMQETIRRFAPDTIRARISARGWLKSVLPGSREATLWRAYESEFKAFADESEAAYLDLFAKQFKKAYERIVSKSIG